MKVEVFVWNNTGDGNGIPLAQINVNVTAMTLDEVQTLMMAFAQELVTEDSHRHALAKKQALVASTGGLDLSSPDMQPAFTKAWEAATPGKLSSQVCEHLQLAGAVCEIVDAHSDPAGISTIEAAPPASEYVEALQNAGSPVLYQLRLTLAGFKKVEIIKTIRSLMPGVTLKQAKDLVASTPSMLPQLFSYTDALKARAQLVSHGASVSIIACAPTKEG